MQNCHEFGKASNNLGCSKSFRELVGPLRTCVWMLCVPAKRSVSWHFQIHLSEAFILRLFFLLRSMTCDVRCRPYPALASDQLKKLATLSVAPHPLPRQPHHHHDPRERHHPGHHPGGDPDGGGRGGGGGEDDEVGPATRGHAHPGHTLLSQCEGWAARLLLRLHGLSQKYIAPLSPLDFSLNCFNLDSGVRYGAERVAIFWAKAVFPAHTCFAFSRAHLFCNASTQFTDPLHLRSTCSWNSQIGNKNRATKTCTNIVR